MGLGFVLYERKLEHGILDPVMYRHREIAIGNFSGFSIHLTQMATLIPITFYMQAELGYSTGRIGGILALQAIFMGISAPVAGWLRDRAGALIPTVGGPLLCGLSTSLIIWGTLNVYSISIFLIVFGIGIGCFQATNNAEIMSAAPEDKVSLIGSMLALLRYLGMIIGTGLAVMYVGSIGGYTAVEEQVYSSDMRHLFMICGALGLLVAAFGFMRPRNKPHHSVCKLSA